MAAVSPFMVSQGPPATRVSQVPRASFLFCLFAQKVRPCFVVARRPGRPLRRHDRLKINDNPRKTEYRKQVGCSSMNQTRFATSSALLFLPKHKISPHFAIELYPQPTIHTSYSNNSTIIIKMRPAFILLFLNALLISNPRRTQNANGIIIGMADANMIQNEPLRINRHVTVVGTSYVSGA